jgi:protocatechuate 3,4-dioxygenase beta subunit
MALTVGLLVLALAVPARAQEESKQDKKREAQLRTVRGTVTEKDDNPVAAAVVYLKNVKTLSVQTHITDDSGHYKFSGLDPNVDYEIHAEKDELTSAVRPVSSYDNRKDIPVFLKLDKKKSSK